MIANRKESAAPSVESDRERDERGCLLDAVVQNAIGRSLQDHYNDIVQAQLPDKFLLLLAELEARELQHGE